MYRKVWPVPEDVNTKDRKKLKRVWCVVGLVGGLRMRMGDNTRHHQGRFMCSVLVVVSKFFPLSPFPSLSKIIG